MGGVGWLGGVGDGRETEIRRTLEKGQAFADISMQIIACITKCKKVFVLITWSFALYD